MSGQPSTQGAPRANRLLMRAAAGLLVVFVLGIVLQNEVPFLPQINRIAGIALMLLYALHFLQERPGIPTEILLYGGFVLWGIVTGFIVAADRTLLLDSVRTLVQLWGLAWAVAGLAALRRDADMAFLALIVSGVVIVTHGFVTGDFRIPSGPSLGQRATSFLRNPNDLGYYGFLGIAGLLYFWGRASGRLWRWAIVLLIAPLTLVVVYSGSRKAFLGLLFFALAWLWFCYRRQLLQRPGTIVLILTVLAGLYLLTDYAYTSTPMGVRLQASIEEGGLDAKREAMYQEGLLLFLENPVAGVGLGNFTAYSWFQTYSHSDYMEALSTTGIVGSALYFSIYPLLWRRLSRIKRGGSAGVVQYHVGLFQAFILTLLVLAIGRINFQSILTWVALAGIIGYACALGGKGLAGRPKAL